MSITDLHMGILQVVYEDGHMACVVKPAGMPTTQVNSICRSYHNFCLCLVSNDTQHLCTAAQTRVAGANMYPAEYRTVV